MKALHLVSFAVSTVLASSAALAQADARGCKDHPLFNRLGGFSIYECKKAFNALPILYDTNPKSARNAAPEGDLTSLAYIFHKSPDQSNAPSELQVMRNYQNAAKAKGGEVLVERPGYTALKFKREGGGAVYATVRSGSGGYRLYLDILEEKAMTQEVTANLLWDTLEKNGFVALPILFDTNKAVIKPESMPLVNQVVAMMKSRPALKVSIEGHTDSVGDDAANKVLSKDRAAAVVAAVAAEGVTADRMSAVGWGEEKPVADNRTEDGRAKNRRVEIVKK